MSLLHLTVPAYHNELLGSLCSRTAAANGIESAHLFAKDMSFSFVRMRAGVEPDLTRFSELVGISHEVLASMPRIHERLLTWNGHCVRELDVCQMTRFCPDCMLEANGGRRPEIGQYLRVEWAIEAVEACMVHGRRLITSAGRIGYLHKFDLCAVLRSEPALWKPSSLAHDRMDDVLGKAIVARLYTDVLGESWVDTLSLNAIIGMSEALGTTLRHGGGGRFRMLDEKERRAARGEGFQLLKEGRTAVLEHVRELARVFPRKKMIRSKGLSLFGELQMTAYRTRGYPELDQLRKILVEAIDEISPKPTIPTINTVAARLGLHRAQVRRLLSLKGLSLSTIPTIGDAEPNLETLFHDWILLEQEAAQFLNMPILHLQGLVRLGALRPLVENIGKDAFSIEDLRDVLKRLRFLAHAANERIGQTDLETAEKIVRCSPEHLLELMLHGRLTTAQFVKTAWGYRAIKIDPMELSDLTHSPLKDSVPLFKVRRRLGVSLKDVHALLEKGYLPTQSRLHPLTGRAVSVVSCSALEDFCDTYVSLEQIGTFFKGQRSKTEVATWLAEHRMKPAFPPNTVSKPFFLRSEI
ncbi:TniQ family protein [Rhizobium phaseoli]|uniref:TniQ family protein n=1 Tax=Rhizobium phaseoli TaxID=396 RepID=UPI000BE94FB8|nr:TniQ family protein [Rhizobium phaseoli]PDS28020.1 hypothetical protein CO650_28685 [Rhizobium phaseoli]